MIELPEAVRLASQVEAELKGKVIVEANCGNSPHKWAFYSRPQEEYAEMLPGKKIGKCSASGSMACIGLTPGHALLLGDGGLRVLLHEPVAKLPAKYQLMLRFADDSILTVSVQGWGFLHLVTAGDAKKRFAGHGLSPLSDEFTYQRFKALLDGYERAEKDAIKKVVISGGLISGVGNGYLHDVLFRAGIHPRRKLAEIDGNARRRLFSAVRKTVRDATKKGGRDTEFDLHGERGGYRPILDSRMKGETCPQCATPIEKFPFLGGACYVCPACQT
jgi:formamidopyrimidine-DNA glycosylase